MWFKWRWRIIYYLRVIKNNIISCLFYILALFYSLFREPHQKIDREKIKNIIIISLLRIGDTVVTTPTIRAIKENLPNVNLTLITSSISYPLVKNNHFISSIIKYDKESSIIEFYKLIKIIRKNYYEVCLVLDYSFLSSIIAYLSGAKIRIGYNWLNKGFLLTHKLPLPKWANKPGWLFRNDNSFIHEIDLKLKLVETLGIKAKDKMPQVFIKKDEEEKVEEFLKENKITENELLIGIHPGAERSYQWNISSFAELTNILTSQYNAKIVITGSKKDRKLAEKIVSLANGAIISTCGKFSLERSCALIKKLKLLISVDTGITHIASAFGVPTVVLFGPGDSRIWRPYGDNHIIIQKDIECFACKLPRCVNLKHYCMDLISVDEVLEAVKYQLERIRK